MFDITTRIIKDNTDVFTASLYETINSAIKLTSNRLKQVDIASLRKKSKENYRPMSILSTLLKIFERVFLSKCQVSLIIFYQENNAALEKGHSAQHFLLNLLEKCKNSVDDGKSFGALLTDFSNAFDWFDQS